MEPGVLRTGGQPCWGFPKRAKVGLGAGAWLLGPVATPTSVLGWSWSPHGLGPPLGGFPGSPGPLPLWGPENGQPARTAVAGVCSGSFPEVLIFSKPGIILVSLKCIREHWACWLLQAANLSGGRSVPPENQSAISMGAEPWAHVT